MIKKCMATGSSSLHIITLMKVEHSMFMIPQSGNYGYITILDIGGKWKQANLN